MSNFCGECGSSLDPKFKFCPNCGNELGASRFSDKTSTASKAEKLMICENCGEDNLVTNVNCSTCGAKLKGKLVESEGISTENIRKNQTIKREKKKVTKEKKIDDNVKLLDSKKILLVSATVIAIIVVLLAFTGVFNSGLNQVQQPTDNETGSGVNLTNLNEITQLENAVKSNPNDKSSIIKLANLLQDSGLYDRAIIYYKKYLESDSSDADARVDMGICFYNINDFQSAIAEMQTALQYQPRHQLAHLNLGIVNLTAGNIDLSKEWFRKALEIDPNSQAGKRAEELLQSH
jgi:cytochrome c-type biogenesis protein CcmH/NrfG